MRAKRVGCQGAQARVPTGGRHELRLQLRGARMRLCRAPAPPALRTAGQAFAPVPASATLGGGAQAPGGARDSDKSMRRSQEVRLSSAPT
jgi:hypothetical protein